MAYAGRLAVEKNPEAFLQLDLPGTKLVIGEGPRRALLSERFPSVVFAGYRFGDDLVRLLASADVFVFPSLTDTFGLAMIEAGAWGVPVAAFPVPGPIDVIDQGRIGVLHEDLATEQFICGLEPIPAGVRSALAVRRGSAIIAGQPSGAGDTN